MPAEPGYPARRPPQADEEAEGADLTLRDGERPGALEDEHDADSDERVGRSADRPVMIRASTAALRSFR